MQEATIEIQPPRFFTHILLADNPGDSSLAGKTTELSMSSKDTVNDLRKAIIAAHFPLNAEPHDKYRIWKLNSEIHEGGEMQIAVNDLIRIGAILLEESDSDLVSASIDNGDTFVLESKIGNEWLVDASQVPTRSDDFGSSQLTQDTNVSQPLFGTGADFFTKLQNSSESASDSNTFTVVMPNRSSLKPSALTKPPIIKDPRQLKINKLLPGTLGLGNMYVHPYCVMSRLILYFRGNTCFMNSAIQCLAHTKELADYFLSMSFLIASRLCILS
jgi:ubiquitin carboxyl-terminal hydrolase 4/11